LVYEKETSTVSLLVTIKSAGNMPLAFSSQARLRTRSKESVPKGPGIELPPTAVVTPRRDYGVSRRGHPYSSPLAAVGWSDGALQNFKFQAPDLRVLGVREKTKKLKPEH
jgi:hypothetical protein